MLMARIGRLEGIKPGADIHDDIDQMLHFQIVRPRPHIDAVAGVMPNAVYG